ncbi:MAG: glycosyltransferase, partial [Bacteroidota bacterium]|nr:glycosyltransferase [Bacteroidota bacterium]
LWWGNFIDRDLFDPALLVYDICDALEVQSRSDRTLARLRSCESALAREADLITYSAHEMGGDIARRFPGKSSLLVPNAVSREFITRLDSEPRVHPRGDIPHIGYIGATNGKWFDAELVIDTIRRFPDCRISIIGPVDKRFAEQCAGMAHVQLHGYVRHDELARHLRRFDVALIPFRDNSITRVVNPLKLYEYASAGLPVVATRTAELTHYAEFCYLAGDSDAYAARIRLALEEDGEPLRARRRRFANENTWEQRVATLLAGLLQHEAAA